MEKLIGRILAIIPAAIVQVGVIVLITRWLAPWSASVNVVLSILAIVFALYIITKHDESTYKILWLLIILPFPVFGALLYLLFGNRRTVKPLSNRIERSRKGMPPVSAFGGEPTPACREIARVDERLAQTFRYVERFSGYPTLKNVRTTYYPIGEQLYDAMLEAVRGAKQYVFAEYFILKPGVMLDTLVALLEQKAAAGVDVRIMYDDWGCFSSFSQANADMLHDRGIKCIRFNPLWYLSGTINYRDHRKILVVDGVVAFSGGVNLADEYINRCERFGHWKDGGFMVEGAPARVYTRMFAEFWNAFSDEPVSRALLQPLADEMPDDEMPETGMSMEKAAALTSMYDGYVLSYYDSPVHRIAITNDLYRELVGQAKHTAWFFTPYLLPSESLLDSCMRAAQRGVDVRIILPGIPDKRIVYRMSRSYYQPLLHAGVRIFEYVPGFVHAKGCVIDGKVGAIGTVNLDYRSLFLNFENNALLYGASALRDFEADFVATQRLCRERTLDDIGSGPATWLVDSVLRIVSPLC
ncbi:phospholipase D-like domain-containing protein [Adlercreutzia sp. ZJ138]|uniref:phospholipase D-like domain-containing protein n=1 Tax=Adlercreutzia sp. ZJ138 TaxID=2709405 RepID=UPI0013EB49C0|nr:phospholipase D-like domain-containing protein [Adlercreutzia sp. ZJ138]